jgi:hypothetical protein
MRVPLRARSRARRRAARLAWLRLPHAHAQLLLLRRALHSARPARAARAAPPHSHAAPCAHARAPARAARRRQLPEDEDEIASVMSRGDIMRLARDASRFLGTAEPEEAPGSEMKPMRAPTRPRFDEEDEPA